MTGATTERDMAKLIQICASQNDLFGLDGDGLVHQYNFNTNTWMKLGRGRSGPGGSSTRPTAHRVASTDGAGARVRRDE